MQFSIKQIIKVGLYGLAVLVSMLPILNPFNAFSSLQNYSFDTFQQLFPREVYEDDPVVIVDIDDRSLELVVVIFTIIKQNVCSISHPIF